MAQEKAAIQVEAEADGAVRALLDIAAGRALQEAGKAAAIQKQYGLLARAQDLSQRLHQLNG